MLGDAAPETDSGDEGEGGTLNGHVPSETTSGIAGRRGIFYFHVLIAYATQCDTGERKNCVPVHGCSSSIRIYLALILGPSYISHYIVGILHIGFLYCNYILPMFHANPSAISWVVKIVMIGHYI